MTKYETGSQTFMTPEELGASDPDTQREVMEIWFRRRYEDPAQRTPYESAEGGYRAYSISVTDSAELAAAVSQYNRREAELNRLEGRSSDCQVVARPQLHANNGRCEIAREY